MLLDSQARILQIQLPSAEESMKTIQELVDKNPRNALYEKRHWITAVLQQPELDHLRVYVGCSECGKKTYALEGQSFPCLSETCRGKQMIASPRVAFNFVAVDKTAAMELSAFAEACEEMLGKTTEELRIIKHTKNLAEFGIIQQKLQTLPMHFKVGPSQALMRSGALQWQLKVVERIDGENTIPKKSGVATSDEIPSSYLISDQDTTGTYMLQSLEPPIDSLLQHAHTPDSKAAAKGKQKMFPAEPQLILTPPAKGLTIREAPESPFQIKVLPISEHQTSPFQKEQLSISNPNLTSPQNHPISKATSIPTKPIPQNTTPRSHIEEIISTASETRMLPGRAGSTNKKASETKVTPETPLQIAEK